MSLVLEYELSSVAAILCVTVNLYLNLLPLDDCRNLAKVLNHPQG